MTAENRGVASELLLLLALATLWGASYTCIKIGVETIPPVTLIACTACGFGPGMINR